MNPHFQQLCGYRPNPENDYEVRLDGDLIFENDDCIIRVYAGFASDGGSLPRLTWTLLGITPFDTRCVYAFFIHDFLYRSHLLSQAKSDAILAEILTIPPSPNAVQRWLIWANLQLWGWKAYNGKTQTEISEACKYGEITRKRTLAPIVIR